MKTTTLEDDSKNICSNDEKIEEKLLKYIRKLYDDDGNWRNVKGTKYINAWITICKLKVRKALELDEIPVYILIILPKKKYKNTNKNN